MLRRRTQGRFQGDPVVFLGRVLSFFALRPESDADLCCGGARKDAFVVILATCSVPGRFPAQVLAEYPDFVFRSGLAPLVGH